MPFFLYTLSMSQKIINQALEELNKKNINKAQSILLKLIKKESANTRALTILSIIKFQYEKNLVDALKYSGRAVQLKSQDINPYIIAGISALQLNKYQQANDYLKSGYQMNNQNRDILFNLAISSAELQNYDMAINCYEKCISLNEKDYGAKVNLANLYRKIDQDVKAEEIYLELLPLDQPIINKNYLSLLFKRQDYKPALELAKKICDREYTIPNLMEYLRGAIEMKDIALSEKLLSEINLTENTEYQYFKISHFLNQGEYELALTQFETFFNILDHELDSKLLTLYCIILSGIEREEEADKKFRELIMHFKNISVTKYYSLWLLSKNRLEEGFSLFYSRLSDRQREIVKPVDLKLNAIKGKKSLFIADQGIGDQIFFMRFLKKLNLQVESITLAVDNKIVPIVIKYFPQHTVISKEELNSINIAEEFEIIQYLGDLPYLLDIELDNISGCIFDIHAQPKNYNDHERKRVGISWNSKSHRMENEKSISIELIRGIISQSTNEFINLQYDNFEDVQELKEFENFQSYDEIDKKNDLVGLCNLIDTCDYVITVSNVTAHLCGMLNKKTFLLLPNIKRSIWYWNQLDGERSLWYPTIEVINLKNYNLEKLINLN